MGTGLLMRQPDGDTDMHAKHLNRRHIGAFESREARLNREAAARVNSTAPEWIAIVASLTWVAGVLALCAKLGGF